MANFNFVMLRDLKTILKVIGMESYIVSSSMQILHRIYNKVLVSISTIFVISQFIALKYMHGLSEYTHNIAFMIVFVETWVKFLIFTFTNISEKIQDIYEFEKRVIINQEDQQIVKIYDGYVKYFNRMYKVLSMIIASVCVSLCLRPFLLDLFTHVDALYDIVDNSTMVYRKRPLPVKNWVPFDVYKYYYWTFLLQFTAALVTTVTNIGTDGCLIGFMLFSAARAKILQYNLQNVREVYPDYAAGNELLRRKFDKEHIKECVMEHQDIIRFVADVNKWMSGFMLSHFIGCSIQIAITAFWIIVDTSTILGVALVYLMAIFTQLFVLYTAANIVTTDCADIAEGVWNSKWYKCAIPEKRSLQLIMMRSQRPIYLKIGPMYAMSNETALLICKGAYSYVTVFIKINED